jgi:AraC family transcriptional regulator of adaptative response/methylated-DNA-[protein]-cysteine methyltransferase
MMFDFPDDDTLYDALLTRDAQFEGRAYVCVATTGIFCRLTCPARKPLRQNCTFRPSIGACITAGFRPCKRCTPLAPAAKADPQVATLLAALDAQPDKRWAEGDITAIGFDLSTIRRAFKRHFGMTFLEMARQRRLREGFESLSSGATVITAQFEASFESASGFRAAFARLLGAAPGDLGTTGLLLASWIPTPLGDMIAISSAQHLHLLEFVGRKALPAEVRKLATQAKGALGLGSYGPTEQVRAELAAYFAGHSAQFDTPLAMQGSTFAKAVWSALRDIPAGERRSYGQIARDIGAPAAIRAVARANGANQIALLVPCHRVLGSDGSLTGYGGGLWRKQRLLEIEQQFQPLAR